MGFIVDFCGQDLLYLRLVSLLLSFSSAGLTGPALERAMTFGPVGYLVSQPSPQAIPENTLLTLVAKRPRKHMSPCRGDTVPGVLPTGAL